MVHNWNLSGIDDFHHQPAFLVVVARTNVECPLWKMSYSGFPPPTHPLTAVAGYSWTPFGEMSYSGFPPSTCPLTAVAGTAVDLWKMSYSRFQPPTRPLTAVAGTIVTSSSSLFSVICRKGLIDNIYLQPTFLIVARTALEHTLWKRSYRGFPPTTRPLMELWITGHCACCTPNVFWTCFNAVYWFLLVPEIALPNCCGLEIS